MSSPPRAVRRSTPAPATRRINRGNGHSYVLEGRDVLGVTTILSNGVPKPALEQWAADETAGYAVDHWTELEALTPSKRIAELRFVRYGPRDRARKVGTQIHRWAETLLAGGEVAAPDELRPYVEQCARFLDDYEISDEALSEAPVIYRPRAPWWGFAFMGTLDLLEVAGPFAGWLFDYKTGKGIYPESSLQAAAYGHCQTYVAGPDDERPLPPVTDAAAVHLRDDGYDVYPLDVSDATFTTFLYVQQVARFTTADRSAYVGEALPHPTTEEIRP